VTVGLSGAVSAVAGDLDGDGDLDVAGAGWSASGGMAWFENADGMGSSWVRETVDRAFGPSSSVHLADVDGNGSLDLLGSAWEGHELAWWRVGDFVEEGVLTSSILDTGGALEWVDCDWQAEEPGLTSLSVEARASLDPVAMGPWAAIAPGPGCPGLDDGTRYLQYRVTMRSTDPAESPILREIRFTWEPRVSPAPRRTGRRVMP
jgi:hypothetical protein